MSLGNLAIEEKAFFYSLNEHKTAVFEQQFEFDKDIDIEKLREALKETIKYFDRFGLKAVISKDGKPILVENDAEFPIYEDNGQIFILGTKETNGYLYALCVKNNHLRVIFFHLLCDGRGSGFFINTLFLNYIKLEYKDTVATLELEKIGLEDKSHKKNLSDAVTEYVEKNLKSKIGKNLEFDNNENVFIIDTEVKNFYYSSFYSTKIEWDAKKFIEVVHEFETTPFVFIFVLIADAMIECFDVKENSITSNVAVDLRKFLNSTSFYNFGTTIDVSYKKDWYNLDMKEKITMLKKTFEKELNYDNMVADLYNAEQFIKKIADVQNIDWLKTKRDESFGKINTPLFSCFISNVGKSVYPDVISKYVKFAGTLATPINVVPDYTIFTYGDTSIMLQNQNFKNDAVMKKIFEKMRSFDIESKIFDERKIELSHFDTLKLERL